MHRLFHGPLWRFHAIHHSSVDLDWLSSVRLHPLNDVLTRLVQVVPFLLLGFMPTVLLAYLPFLTFHAILLHANVPWSFGPLRHLISSPSFHRWHHTSQSEALSKNFAGLLPLWDWLFGTLYLPNGRQPQQFGVLDQAVPDGFWRQLVHPFRPAQ
jgi:sterol desaturase/sphingolipid hydroxylase (fatty acid hydroxylase superfamily)